MCSLIYNSTPLWLSYGSNSKPVQRPHLKLLVEPACSNVSLLSLIQEPEQPLSKIFVSEVAQEKSALDIKNLGQLSYIQQTATDPILMLMTSLAMWDNSANDGKFKISAALFRNAPRRDRCPEIQILLDAD